VDSELLCSSSIVFWLYLDAEVLIPPPVFSSGLFFCYLPIFVDSQLLHPSASRRARLCLILIFLFLIRRNTLRIGWKMWTPSWQNRTRFATLLFFYMILPLSILVVCLCALLARLAPPPLDQFPVRVCSCPLCI